MSSASRALLSKLSPLTAAAFSRLLRPISAAGSLLPEALWSAPAAAPGAARFFATQPANSSLRDPSPNWSNRPPKETILLDGCDFEHWLVIMEPPPGDAGNPDVPRDEIIDSYIKTLAQVVGSEQEARQKIYSVSTRHYFGFGALVSEELSLKLKGEPFINGEAVPYDPKYHEEWVRNNARANERSRRNDRPRNFDRSRNFERRRENMQNFQNRDVPPGQGFNSPPPPPPPGQNQMLPRDAPPMHHVQGNMPSPPPPNVGAPPSYQPHATNPQAGYTPVGGPNYQQGGPPGYQAGNQGYQGNPGGNRHSGPGPAYQSNNPGYQGGSPPPYQGGNQPPSQGGGGLPSYAGSAPGGNPAHYEGGGGRTSYAGGAPAYQGEGGNPSYEQGGDNYYEGRGGPGRSYQ